MCMNNYIFICLSESNLLYLVFSQYNSTVFLEFTTKEN